MCSACNKLSVITLSEPWSCYRIATISIGPADRIQLMIKSQITDDAEVLNLAGEYIHFSGMEKPAHG